MEDKSKEISKEIAKLAKTRVRKCPKCRKDGAVEFVYKDGKVEVQCAYCEPEKYL